MILAAIFDSVCPDAEAIRPSPGVDEALEVLQYLGDKGNHFALQRLQDIRHLLSLMQERLQVVGRSTRATSENGMQGTTATVPANFEQPSYAVPGGQVSGDNVENARALGGMEGLGAFENNLWDNITTMWLGPPYDTNVDTDTGEMVAGASAEDFYKHYYSAYNSGSWAMSGEDLDDLAALGRQIVNFGDG